MPDCLYPSWHYDSGSRLILLKLPQQIDLDPPNPHYNPNRTAFRSKADLDLAAESIPLDDCTQYGSSRSSSTLVERPTLSSCPFEIQCMIIDHLPPVDRVCLALTCKSICASVMAAPRLTPATWQKFINEEACGRADLYSYFTRSNSLCAPAPESYTLVQRLAHGWIPKDKLRYCWRCHRILSRDPAYWRKRVKGDKRPKWDVRTSCEKEVWNKMSRKKRLQYLITTWCEASFEDSSLLCCDGCREQAYAREIGDRAAAMNTTTTTTTKDAYHRGLLNETQNSYAELIPSSLTPPAPAYIAYATPHDRSTTLPGLLTSVEPTPRRSCLVKKPLLQMTNLQPRYPVECPACLERQLTFTFRLPRKSVFRNGVAECCCGAVKLLTAILWVIIRVSVGILQVILYLVQSASRVIRKGVSAIE